jgi:hypothetical protein
MPPPMFAVALALAARANVVVVVAADVPVPVKVVPVTLGTCACATILMLPLLVIAAVPVDACWIDWPMPVDIAACAFAIELPSALALAPTVRSPELLSVTAALVAV